MAVYNDLEQGKKEKKKQQSWYKIYFMLSALIIAIVVLVLSGYDLNQVFFRNPSEDFYFLLKSFKKEIEFVLFIKAFLFTSFNYLYSVATSSTSFDFHAFSYFWQHLQGVERLHIRIPQSIIDSGKVYQNGNHVWVVTVFYVFSFLYLWGMFRGKTRKYKKFLYLPFSSLFFGNLDETERNLFMFKGGWVEEFKENMFKRYIKEVDGYKRVSFLEYWDKYPIVLSGKDDAYEKHYSFLIHLFKTEKHLIDFFYIVEGYMTKTKTVKKSLFDDFKELLGFYKKKKNYYNHPFLFDKYIDINEEDFNNYQCFNGKDEVTLSLTAIQFFIDKETQAFEEMIRTRMFLGRTELRKNYLVFSNFFKQYPQRFLDMLFSVKNGNVFANQKDAKTYKRLKDIRELNDEVNERIVFVLVTYFRFILLRECISRYMNIPAGTIVVKLNDYSLRMIVETYASKNLVQIIQGKNDGSNNQFACDVLVNLFLTAYWYYNDLISEHSIEDKLDYHFNTNVLKIVNDFQNQKEMEEVDRIVSESTKNTNQKEEIK